MRAAHDGPRWIPAERWHLTLAFYGEVPDAEVDKVVDRLGRRLGGSADLALALTGAGALQPPRGVAGRHRRRRAAAGAGPGGGPATAAAPTGRTSPSPGCAATPTRRRAVAALSAYAGPGWRPAPCTWCARSSGPSPTYDDIATLAAHRLRP